MSRYASKAELTKVIKLTLSRGGVDPATVVLSRVLRDLNVTGDSYYGWTVDLDKDPVEIAQRHRRKTKTGPTVHSIDVFSSRESDGLTRYLGACLECGWRGSVTNAYDVAFGQASKHRYNPTENPS